MSRVEELKKEQETKLRKLCENHTIDYKSLGRLIDAEKVKKLLKRKASMQQTISKEIERNINEN
jgi:hypothetical protein